MEPTVRGARCTVRNVRQVGLRAGLLFGALLAFGGCFSPTQFFVVNSLLDGIDVNPGDGICEMSVGGADCTLRAAVMEANALGEHTEITLPVGTITFTRAGRNENAAATGDLDIHVPTKIVGQDTTIDADRLSGVFHVIGGELILENLTVSGGFMERGGVHVGPGTSLTTTDVTFTGNSWSPLHDFSGLGVSAVYVESGASATLERTTLSDNSTLVATIHNEGNLTLMNSTVSGNGWAIHDDDFADATTVVNTSTGTTSLIHSTITRNLGPGISGPLGGPIAGTVSLASSVVADQIGFDDCVGTPVSYGYNLDSDGTCGLSSAGDISGVDPLLGSLLANGGATDTHAAFPTSPVIDAIPLANCADFPTDQRGLPRPGGIGCDIGAVEGDNGLAASPLSLTVDSSLDAPDAFPGDQICDTGTGTCTLRAAIDESNAWPMADTITLVVDPVLTIPGSFEEEPEWPAYGANSGGDLDLVDDTILEADGHTIDSGGQLRVFDVHGGDSELRSLTLSGAAGEDAAFAITVGSGASVSIMDSTLTNLTGYFSVIQSYGSTTIEKSTISNNVLWPQSPVLVALDGGSIDIRRSTIDNLADPSNLDPLLDLNLFYEQPTITVSGSVLESVGEVCDGSSDITSTGYNWTSDSTCGFGAPGDIVGTDPMLGPLADNGGLTQTRRPLIGSPLLDVIAWNTAGICDATTPIDQRGLPRPAVAATACDIGATERQITD